MNSFRNDTESQRFAALHRPFSTLVPPPPDYAARYGARAAAAANACHQAHARGDVRGLQIHQHALALVLLNDHPQLFHQKVKKCAKR